MNQRILMAGCGRIGSRLAHALTQQGNTVYGLHRSAERPLPKGVIPIIADLVASDDLADRLPTTLDVVYVILTPDQYDDAGYESTYVRGTAALIRALAASGNTQARLVFVSSTGVYGQNQGEWIDETSPTQPSRFSGRRLLEAESIAAQHPGTHSIIRFGGIYGPGREALLHRVARGEACQDNPPLYTNRIHEDDCIGILEHLGAIEQPANVYIGVDNEPASQCEIMTWLADQMGVEPPPRQTVEAGQSGKRCRNQRLIDSGYRLRFPNYRAGYRPLVTDPRLGVDKAGS